jgi:hypothetical protein
MTWRQRGRGWSRREVEEVLIRGRREVETVYMRVEEEGSGGSVYESGGGGKWRECV